MLEMDIIYSNGKKTVVSGNDRQDCMIKASYAVAEYGNILYAGEHTNDFLTADTRGCIMEDDFNRMLKDTQVILSQINSRASYLRDNANCITSIDLQTLRNLLGFLERNVAAMDYIARMKNLD